VKTLTRSHTFVHERKPKSKERPRSRGKGRPFTPKATLEYEADVAASYDGPKFEGPVKMHLVFYKDQTMVTLEELDEEPTKLRGDIDNYVKSVLDGLNGVAYDDDRQVTVLHASKVY
jgi:crossover junction endodeoxyribonuclease RusA